MNFRIKKKHAIAIHYSAQSYLQNIKVGKIDKRYLKLSGQSLSNKQMEKYPKQKLEIQKISLTTFSMFSIC